MTDETIDEEIECETCERDIEDKSDLDGNNMCKVCREEAYWQREMHSDLIYWGR